MAKKIRFPLKMANGTDVRTIEELRTNFDLTTVLGYYADGKLITWLRDRFYDTEADKIEQQSPQQHKGVKIWQYRQEKYRINAIVTAF